jgi:molecular chaperone DnaK
MASPVLGLDLGTTNSVVGVSDGASVRVLLDEKSQPLTPSCVSFHPSGEVLVGAEAKERRLVDAENTVFSVKRLIGRPFRSSEVRRAAERLPFKLVEGANGGVMVEARGETYSLPEISAFVLRRMRAVAERALDQSCVSSVITVPANFNELQRTATRDAGRIAGLNILRILNEPTAAALAYGFDAGKRERIAVYDLGGGTFDVSVLDLSGDVIEVVATAGDTYLGGDDVDALIADRMAESFLKQQRMDLRADPQAYERLRMAAEWVKCRLSEVEEATVEVQEIAYGKGGKPVHLQFEMTRRDLESLAFPLVGRTFDICEQALGSAGLRPAQLDNVILVGGQTRMPQVRRMVAEYFGRQALSSVDPDQVVAQGAALQAFALSGRAAPAAARWKTTLSAPPPPPEPPAAVPMIGARKREPTLEYPLGIASTEVGFDDEPTRVATRAEDDPGFDELPTTVSTRPLTPIPKRGASTLSGMGGPDSVRLEAAIARSAEGPLVQPIARVELATRPVAVPPPVPASLRAPPVPRDVLPIVQEPLPTVHDEISLIDDLPGRLEAPSSELPAALASVPVAAPSALPATPSALPATPSAAPSTAQLPVAPRPSAAPLLTQAPPGGKAAHRPRTEPRAAPLLLDVTPHSLGIETAGGYCEQVIGRNAPIPTEQTRIFSTSQDNQMMVSVRVCQGEARRTDENQVLGAVELLGLRQGPRGEVKIGVTFMLDANGTLSVKAEDTTTGRTQQIRINLVGALSDSEVQRLRQRHANMAERGA